MDRLGIGVIGCGNISKTYFELAPLFKGIEMRACADANPEASKAAAAKYGLRAQSVEDLLAAPDIDIVVNLTIPDAHFNVSRRVLEASKHVYSEKPFVLSLDQALELRGLAEEKGLRIGSAPDTFLGGAPQQARAHIDDGEAGEITSGTAMVMSHGMEHWHPNPDFFFLPGGGPVLDLGPYYITTLVHLIGPVKRVAALATAASPTRTISSKPRAGETIPVKTPTNIHALLEFASGATVTLISSWDVWAHRHENMELYGTKGSLYIPDPNFFGGEVIAGGGDYADMAPLKPWDHPFGRANQTHPQGDRANYRTAGLADMAQAIMTGRPHRCGEALATHVIDTMTAILKAGENREFLTLSTICERPEALPPEAARALLA